MHFDRRIKVHTLWGTNTFYNLVFFCGTFCPKTRNPRNPAILVLSTNYLKTEKQNLKFYKKFINCNYHSRNKTDCYFRNKRCLQDAKTCVLTENSECKHTFGHHFIVHSIYEYVIWIYENKQQIVNQIKIWFCSVIDINYIIFYLRVCELWKLANLTP